MNINQVKTDSLKNGLTWAVLRKALCDDNYPLLMFLLLHEQTTTMYINLAHTEGGDAVTSYGVMVDYLKAKIPLEYQNEWDKNMLEYTETYRMTGDFTQIHRTDPKKNKGVIATRSVHMTIDPPSWPKALAENYRKCVEVRFTHSFPTKIELENCVLTGFQKIKERHGRYGFFGNIFVHAKDLEEEIAAWITYRPKGELYFCFRTFPSLLTELHGITSELSEEEVATRRYREFFAEKGEHGAGSPSYVQKMIEPTEEEDDYQDDEYDDFDEARDATIHTHMQEVMDRQERGTRE